MEKAGALLRDGKLVAIPTETVYGLAANALDGQAVAAIFAAKNRPTFDPLIVHFQSLAAVSDYVTEFPEKARRLAEAFWPGPLTLLLPKKPLIPDLVTSGLPTVAVRVPRHPLTLELLRSLDFPLAAPSANPFGYISPTTAPHVAQQLGDRIPYILDGGECGVGIESTIVSFGEKAPRVLRLGGLRLEDIEKVVGRVETTLHSSSNPSAPGMLKSHYAPRKPLFLLCREEMVCREPEVGVGYLFFLEPGIEGLHEDCLFLGEREGLSLDRRDAEPHRRPGGPAARRTVRTTLPATFRQAAQNLFGYLRRLDASSVKEIRAEILPEVDLGRAINDRLRRASVKD